MHMMLEFLGYAALFVTVIIVVAYLTSYRGNNRG